MKLSRIYILLSLPLMLLVSCMTKEDFKNPGEGEDISNNLVKPNHGIVYQDTITPPSNPLLPPSDGLVCISGALVRTVVATNAFSAGVRAASSGHTYILLSDSTYMRFNNPLLSGLHMADTIAVTGVLFQNRLNEQFYIEARAIDLISPYVE